MKMVRECRKSGISSEVYPSSVKMKKQMKYANDRGVKHVVLLGQDEMERGVVKLKNMDSGEQVEITLEELINRLS